MEPEQQKEEDLNSGDNSPDRFAGFVLGAAIGALVVATQILKSTPSQFRDSSKIVYLLILLGFGMAGAIFGKKFMTKLMEWLHWL